MLIIKHTVKTSASISALWRVLEDVATWNAWDHGIEYSTLEGPFKMGVTGTLKPKDGPLLQTKLTKVEPMKMFVQEAKMPGARVVMSHFLAESDGKSTVTFQTEVRGPLAFVWALLIGPSIKKKVPIEMAAMVKKAELLSQK
jgi:hypothetical protein